MAKPKDENRKELIRACVGDAYWICLSPGPGNGRAAKRLYDNLKRLQRAGGR